MPQVLLAFPAAQVHVVNRDDMMRRPEEVMAAIHDFLGLQRLPIGKKVRGFCILGVARGAHACHLSYP